MNVEYLNSEVGLHARWVGEQVAMLTNSIAPQNFLVFIQELLRASSNL